VRSLRTNIMLWLSEKRFGHLRNSCDSSRRGCSGSVQFAVAVEERERLAPTQTSACKQSLATSITRFRLMFSRLLQHQLHRRTTTTTPAQRQQLYTVESCLNAQTSSSRASPSGLTMSVKKGLSRLLSGRRQPSSLRASKLPSTLFVAFTSAIVHLSHRSSLTLTLCVSQNQNNERPAPRAKLYTRKSISNTHCNACNHRNHVVNHTILQQCGTPVLCGLHKTGLEQFIC
jgi:hypothetical protein